MLVTTLADAFVTAATLAGEPLPSELLAEASTLHTSVHLGWVVRNLLQQPAGYITAACQEVQVNTEVITKTVGEPSRN